LFEDPDGAELLRIDSLTARMHWTALLRRRVVLDSARVSGVSVRMVQRQDGSWGLSDRPEDPDDPDDELQWLLGPGGLSVRGIAVRVEPHAAAVPERTRFLDARAYVGEAFLGDSVRVVIDSVLAQYRPAGAPDDHVVRLAAAAVWSDDIVNIEWAELSSPGTNLQAKGGLRGFGDRATLELVDFEIQADPLDLRDVRLLLPTLRAQGSVTFQTRFSGPLADLTRLLAARSR